MNSLRDDGFRNCAAFFREARPSLGTIGGLVVAACSVAPSAYADSAATIVRTKVADTNAAAAVAVPGRWTADASSSPLPQQVAQARATATPGNPALLANAAADARLVDYHIGWQTGRLTIGLGLSTIAPSGTAADAVSANRVGPWRTASADAFSGNAMGLGLSYRWTEDARVTFDSRASAGPVDVVPHVRVGIEFKSAPSQVLGLARGTLFRMQLSSSSQLQLGLRHGELGLMLRSQF